MENTFTISEYEELLKCKWKVEQMERIVAESAPSWIKDEMISFVLGIKKEETNA